MKSAFKALKKSFDYCNGMMYDIEHGFTA